MPADGAQPVLEGSGLKSVATADKAEQVTTADKAQDPHDPYRLFHFASNYVADHIIIEDAALPGSKAKFRPPYYSMWSEIRLVKSHAEEGAKATGVDSPELKPTDIEFDRLTCNSSFDPPVEFVSHTSDNFRNTSSLTMHILELHRRTIGKCE